ncbi:MAG: sugar-binding protein, partial [Pirellulales bacterium]
MLVGNESGTGSLIEGKRDGLKANLSRFCPKYIGTVLVSLGLFGTVQAQTNLIRDVGFEANAVREWSPAKNVAIEWVAEGSSVGNAALKVRWSDVAAFTEWAKAGSLLRTTDRILTRPLQRDTRYRLSFRMKVERFELAPEASAWYAKLPEGQFDPPTVTVGCQGGYWNSGMPWMAYDMAKRGAWQELHCEFVTPFNSASGFLLTLDVYPHYQAPIRSSGVLYLDDVRLEACPPRVGFTRSRNPKQIDGKLSDWWQTNPVVITSDQVVCGDEAANRDASGLLYTVWDDSHLYVAAKVIDDDVTGSDGVAVLLDGREYFVSTASRPTEGNGAFRRVAGLGATANMYRIVSQYGEEVRRRDGYVVELAIPLPASGAGEAQIGQTPPSRIAFEIRDMDSGGESRQLRYPYNAGSVEQQGSAQVQWANEQGELRGGERPLYAITDAANDRVRPRTLAVKHVASHRLVQGRIGYPFAPYRQGDPQKVDAVVSWTTNLPASGRLEYGPDESYGQVVAAANAVGEPASNAMRVVLRGLQPDRRYHFRVVARVVDGDAEQTSDDFVLDTTRTRVDGNPFGEIALTLRNSAAVVRRAWPVTSGVPFPQGELGSTKNLQLVDESNETVAAQFAPLAEWPDGSIKWVLVDFQSDIPAGGHRSYTLTYGSAVTATLPATPLRVREDATRIRIDTGVARFVLNKEQFNLFDEVRVGDRVVAGGGRLVMVDGQGRSFFARKPDLVEIEEIGPLRVCVRVAGKYTADDGTTLFNYEVRIHAYAGSSRVRINHNYTCRLVERTDPSAGRMRPVNPAPITIKSMWLELPLRVGPVSSLRCGTAADDSMTVPLTRNGVEIRQEYESKASIASHRFTRLPGWISVGEVTIGVRHFWQLYPKAMAIRPAHDGCVVRIDTLPAISESGYPSEPNTPEDYVWGYLKDGEYRLHRGEGRSHDIFMNFGTGTTESSAEAAAMIAEPLMAAAEPEWYCASGAIGAVQPRSDRFAAYDRNFEQALEGILKSRESEPFFENRFGRYGLRNFGDNFGSDGMNWDNVEYDMGHCCLTQFMRTGDLLPLQVGTEILLHNMDVDCVHMYDGFEYLCHHTGDHSVKLAGTGHTWCEGLWEYYYLTGDRHAAQKAMGIGNKLAREAVSICAGGQPGAGGSRTFGWSVIGLLATFQATADPLYLNAAREIEEVAVRTQHPFRGGWLHRLSVGHCYHA